MALNRRRVLDMTAAISGVLLLVVALLVFDQRTRHPWTSADLASVGADVNYLAMGVSLMVAQVVRGELAEQWHLLAFAGTAVVLVVMLMRL